MSQVQLQVQLLSYTPEPEKIITGAAKLCYSSLGVGELFEQIDNPAQERFIRMLLTMGHESPVEHVSFTFGIEGVSRSLLAQLTRHRIASYSVKSQRYVQEGQFRYVIPPGIEEIPEARSIFIRAMEEDQRHYDELTGLLWQRHYAQLLAAGESPEGARAKAEKKAIEDARFILPNACETRLIMTMNARSLFNFFHHRCCRRAQWEIYSLAKEMLRLVRGVAPTLFKDAGPRCLTGPCPEGKLSCGEREAVRKEYTF